MKSRMCSIILGLIISAIILIVASKKSKIEFQNQNTCLQKTDNTIKGSKRSKSSKDDSIFTYRYKFGVVQPNGKIGWGWGWGL